MYQRAFLPEVFQRLRSWNYFLITGYLRQDCLNKFAETHVNNTQKQRHDYDKDQDGGTGLYSLFLSRPYDLLHFDLRLLKELGELFNLATAT